MPYTTIMSAASPHADMTVVRYGPGIVRMELDGYYQWDSRNEWMYHELLADIPAMFAPRLGEVLILGGGDGLAARNLLRYPDVRGITLVDIDPEVLSAARRPPLSDLNEGSLLDPRVTVVRADALEWARQAPRGKWDLVVEDFPAVTSMEIARLFMPEAWRTWLGLSRTPGGVLSGQISENPDILEMLRRWMIAEGNLAWTVKLGRWNAPFESFIHVVHGSSDMPVVRRPAPDQARLAALIGHRIIGMLRRHGAISVRLHQYDEGKFAESAFAM